MKEAVKVKVYQECECGGRMIQMTADMCETDESVYWSKCDTCGMEEYD